MPLPLLSEDFKDDGPCTAEDYWNLPNGVRAELMF